MKLTINENDYEINSKVSFNPSPIHPSLIGLSFEFAYEMAFGAGHHRNHRTGGQEKRSSLEIFKNTLQGKIAEGVCFEVLKKQEIQCDPIDYSIHGKGVWDDTDINYKGNKISIKSVAFFSNLLLLETKDWNLDGSYTPNKEKPEVTSIYDYFILVRVKPNTNSMFNNTDKETLKNEIDSFQWYYDIPGCCSLKTLKFIISEGYIIPQNAVLNGKTKMDAENYYIQTGDLKSLKHLVKLLKENK